MDILERIYMFIIYFLYLSVKNDKPSIAKETYYRYEQYY
jgi:hypothetical protein